MKTHVSKFTPDYIEYNKVAKFNKEIFGTLLIVFEQNFTFILRFRNEAKRSFKMRLQEFPNTV